MLLSMNNEVRGVIRSKWSQDQRHCISTANDENQMKEYTRDNETFKINAC